MSYRLGPMGFWDVNEEVNLIRNGFDGGASARDGHVVLFGGVE